MRPNCCTVSFLGVVGFAACSSDTPELAPGEQVAQGSGGLAFSGSGGDGARPAGGQDGPPGAGGGGGHVQATGAVQGELPDCETLTGGGLTINASGWVPAECNGIGIQGSWYCRADGVAPADCTPGSTPFRDGAGMCISGQTVVDSTFAAWGAIIGLSLHEPNGAGSGRQPYDADAAGLTGFQITIEGDTGSQGLRIGYGASEGSAESVPPFVEVPSAGTFPIYFEQASVPAGWETPTAGTTADPSAIYDIQVQIPGGLADESYDFCVTEVQPIFRPGSLPSAVGGAPGAGGAPGSTGGGPATGGVPGTGGIATGGVAGKEAITEIGSGCQADWQLAVPGYYVRNNIWNPEASGQTQCISALGDPGRTYAGFEITECGLGVGSSTPASYPSVVKGWHFGLTTTSSGMPIQVSSIQSIPSTWEFVPPSGTYNVAYDIWLHPQTSADTPDGGMELMIWVAKSAGPNPAGGQVGSANVNNATWTVNQGTVEGWQYLAYVRQGNLSSVDMDLAPFFQDAVSQGWLSGSWNLLGIQAGFEIWNCSGSTGKTSAFSVFVN